MADLVDLKLTQAERKREHGDYEGAPDYPYGLGMTLGEAEIAKIGEMRFQAGDHVTFAVVARVERVESSEVNGAVRRSMRFVIEQMTPPAAKAPDQSAGAALYGAG